MIAVAVFAGFCFGMGVTAFAAIWLWVFAHPATLIKAFAAPGDGSPGADLRDGTGEFLSFGSSAVSATAVADGEAPLKKSPSLKPNTTPNPPTAGAERAASAAS